MPGTPCAGKPMAPPPAPCHRVAALQSATAGKGPPGIGVGSNAGSCDPAAFAEH